MIGLKRGTVALCRHQSEWPAVAQETISELRHIFGHTAVDIQHIGSTAIPAIQAKPIIDLAVGVRRFDDLTDVLPVLERSGVYTRSHNRFSNDLLYVVNDAENRRLIQIHILIFGSPQWRNYVDFRDYLNAFPEKAREYEALKLRLARECDNVQTRYTDGKRDYMQTALAEAIAWADQRKSE